MIRGGWNNLSLFIYSLSQGFVGKLIIPTEVRDEIYNVP